MKKIYCKKCNWKGNDINNLSGALSKHSKIKHNKKYSKNDYIIKEFIPKNPCPICNKDIQDYENKQGGFVLHIKKHNISITEFVKKFPKYEKIFINVINVEKREELLKNPNNIIVCQICKEKMHKLTNTHLSKHNITPTEYKNKFNIKNTASKYTIKNQSEKSNDINIKTKMISKLLETNQKKYGANSFTQTKKGKEKVRKTTFINSYNNYLTSKKINEFVEIMFPLSEYTGVIGKLYPFKCKKCNTIFEGSLENGRVPRCKKCYPLNWGKSIVQDELFNYIKNDLKIKDIIKNNRKIINGKELDIYISSFNLAIEFNGLFWHSEINGDKDKNYHINKTELCEKNNIRLIQIFEDEWLYKKEIVKSRIKNLLNLTDNKLYARNCIIKEIETDIKNNFLNENHIQGEDNSKIKLGAFYNNELVSVMTFSNYKYSKELSTTYELSRFVSKLDTNIIGIFPKFISYFKQNYNVKKIITFADRRWSTNINIYTKNNFALSKIIMPSYWYINTKSIQRYHRFNFRKKLLQTKLLKYDNKLTEWQNMQINNYDRIWDCGNFKYERIL